MGERERRERDEREREGNLLEVGGEMLEARGPALLLRVRQLRQHLVCGQEWSVMWQVMWSVMHQQSYCWCCECASCDSTCRAARCGQVWSGVVRCGQSCGQ